MVRHENDLDFNLPVMLCATNPIVFFWGAVKRDDFRVVALQQHGIQPIFLDGLQKTISERICLKILPLFGKSLYKKYRKTLDINNKQLMLLSLKDQLDRLNPDDIGKIVFDHTVNDTVVEMIAIFRAWKKGVSIYSLPHGYGLIVNKMTNYSLLKPEDNSPDWSVFDKVVSFSEHQKESLFSDLDETKCAVLPSLRNTVEWVELLGEFIADVNQSVITDSTGNDKKKVLIIHNRIASNINYHELVRCLKIMDVHKCFDVRIKPHPRRVSDAIDLVKKTKNVSLIEGHITECIHWADYVMFFHSSAVYDAILLNKPIIYARYTSTNKLDDNVLACCNVLRTPDEFYYFIEQIVNNSPVQYPYYRPLKWNRLVDDWVSFLA